jgi:membrane-associated phospholipid phosphatase
MALFIVEHDVRLVAASLAIGAMLVPGAAAAQVGPPAPAAEQVREHPGAPDHRDVDEPVAPLRPPEPDTLAEPPDTLDFRPWRDGIITGIGGGFWLLEETVLKDAFAPNRCRWCDRDGNADAVNGLDSSARDLVLWDSTRRADSASNISAYLVTPIVAFGMGALAAGREGRIHEWRENSLEVMEAMVIAVAVNKISKVAFARERPYVHFRTDQTRSGDPDENESFTSGHTTLAFSLAVAGGTVASIRGYKTAPWVWGVGLTAAAATGYFRMAADKHYLTDVLGGALTGAAIGWAVPWFLGRRDIPQGEPPPPAPVFELRDGGVVIGVVLVR